jgi:hypothetical protein
VYAACATAGSARTATRHSVMTTAILPRPFRYLVIPLSTFDLLVENQC